MTPTSYAFLLAAFVLGAITLAVCSRLGIIDRLARALEGRRPPPPHVEQRGRGHCRLVHPSAGPSPLSHRSPCDLYDWHDPKDVA